MGTGTCRYPQEQLVDRLRADDAIQRARRADAGEDDIDPGDDEEPGGEMPSGSNAAWGQVQALR